MKTPAAHLFRLKLTTTFSAWLRRDGWALVLFAIATCVMTYPVVFNLNNNWIASYDNDTYVKLWDGWWFDQIIRAGVPLDSTRTLFFPSGLDLTYHSISWTVSGLIWLATPLLGSIGAYNFSILVAIFTTAYGGYVLLRSMVQHPAAAWLGGAVYSFIPHHLTHSGAHPDLVHLAVIPIAMLLLIRAASSYNWKPAVGAALMLGLAAFTGLYIMVFAFITLIPIGLYLTFENRRWRDARFWKTSAVFGVTTCLVIGARVLPIFQSSQTLSTVIEQKYEANTLQTDPVSLITPSQFNPFFAPLVKNLSRQFAMNREWPAYVGVIPVSLGLVALTWKQQRRAAWLWFVVGIVFFILSLGPVLRWHGQVYDNIPLPAALLTWFSPIRAVRPDYFILGLALPLAVGCGLGMDRVLGASSTRPNVRAATVIGICGLVLFEYWNGPFPGLNAAVSPFYTRLAGDPTRAAVIDVPMGRKESKMYQYLQTVHQRPLVEGLSARTPPGAYDYIKANLFLARLRYKAPLNCLEISADELRQALNRLAADNFEFVIVHHGDNQSEAIFAAYLTATPVYTDAAIAVYTLADLQASPPCADPGLR